MSLIVFTRGHRHVPGRARHPAARARAVRHARHRARRGRGGGDQLPRRAEHRRADARARSRAAAAARRAYVGARRCVFAACVGAASACAILHAFVNPLTMWLTLGTFVGYAVIYTVLLKPATPQNIVIGGASGAMPPVLGWAAVTGDVPPEALLLFLIIFVWTPPHFWSLALYRRDDYAKARLPMLPVTHGVRLHAADDRALHGGAGRRHDAAVRDADERPAVSRRGARARRAVPRATPCGCTSRYSDRPRARDVPLSRSSISPRCSRRCWSTTTGSSCSTVAVVCARTHDAHGMSLASIVRVLRLTLALSLAACGAKGPSFQATDITGASFGRDFELTAPRRQAAHARRFPRQGRRDVLRLHAMPRRLPDDARGARATR